MDTDKQIVKLYLEGESTHTIAKMLGTYPNKVKRVLLLNSIPLRGKREAQENAAKQGRYKHPTQGKSHSPEVRAKISEKVHNQWKGLSDAEKEAKRQQAKKNWAAMTDEQRETLQTKAHSAIRRAADEGSKLERFLVSHFMDEGYEVLHHSEYKVGDENMEIDILLPADKIAIEIDGPSHFEPIWGDKSLRRNNIADNKKNGILLGNGFHVIRIRDKSKKITRKIERTLLESVTESITKLAGESKPALIFVEIE